MLLVIVYCVVSHSLVLLVILYCVVSHSLLSHSVFASQRNIGPIGHLLDFS